MSKAILGKKVGMTHIYDENGSMICVTVVEAGPCKVLAVKDKSIQVGFDIIKEKKLKKPQAAFFKKAGAQPMKIIKELLKEPAKDYKVGDELKADLFSVGDFVDITGFSIGKGFQGGMKRWNWSGGPQTHGSMTHRRIGSLGSSTTPGRVWKGHNLPGHMGMQKVTIQNLKVAKVIPESNVLVIKGAVPGHKNNYVLIKTAKKKKRAAVQVQKNTQEKAKPNKK